MKNERCHVLEYMDTYSYAGHTPSASSSHEMNLLV